MIEGKKGVSANQVKRTLGVTYKTAWFLCHRVREAMREIEAKRLSGIIEVDETWVGGKQRGVGKGQSTNKTAVIGAVERDGKIRLQVNSRPRPSDAARLDQEEPRRRDRSHLHR
jgi:hypothetical protein